jgi:hypothetical protein
MRKRIAVIVVCALFAVSCSSSNKPPPDAAPDAPASFCGHPGDVGNDIGVGAFCNTLSDCSNTVSAHLCATLGDPMAHFCTKTCTMGGPADQCGMMATCECQSAGCGCTPNSCIGN